MCDIPTNICTKIIKNGDIIAETNYQKILNNFLIKCQKHYSQVKTQAKNWYTCLLDYHWGMREVGKKSEMQSKYDSHIGKNNINGPIMSINNEIVQFHILLTK